MSFVILKVISNPINLLKSKAREIERGNYNIKVDFSSNDEIGELTKAFNRMSETLKNNYDELKQKQNRITLLLNAFDKSSVAIAIVDAQHNIIEINVTFSQLIGIERDKILGKGIEEIQFYDRARFNYKQIEEGLSASNRYDGEIKWMGPNSREHYLLLSITPTSLKSKETGYLFVEIDITEKKRLEEQLLKSEKLAALGEMAAILAHEIKTPLTSIKMNADILDEVLDLNKEDRAAFSIIQKEINITDDITKNELRNKLIKLGGKTLSNILPKILDNEIVSKNQNEKRATYCKKIKKEDGLLDLSANDKENYNKYDFFRKSWSTYKKVADSKKQSSLDGFK